MRQEGFDIDTIYIYIFFFPSPLFNQVVKLRTSSHLQLRPGQDKAKQFDTYNDRVTHGVKTNMQSIIQYKQVYIRYVNDLWCVMSSKQTLLLTLISVTNKHAPIKKMTVKTVKSPWIDEELKNCMVERDEVKGMAAQPIGKPTAN